MLASGRGTVLKSLIKNCASGKISSQIVLVISNNSDSGAIKLSRKAGINSVHLSEKMFKSRKSYIRRFLDILKENKIDFILLAGYMKKIPYEIIRKYRNRILNIHPSLLPSFGGKGMYGLNVHKAVIDAGVKISGVTVHIVNEDYDSGPILIQKAVPVKDDDTPESLMKRIQLHERKLYVQAIHMIESGKIQISKNGIII